MTPLEEQVLFYHSIGRALEQWASVESQLERIAGACVHPRDSFTIMAGYNSIENFRSKLSFCDSLIKTSAKLPADSTAWDFAHKKCADLSAKRNRMAHEKHRRFPLGTEGRRIGLVPSNVDLGDGLRPPSLALCVRNIEEARQEFFALTGCLANLYEALHGRPTLFPAYPSQSTSPPSLRALRDQIHAELGVQRRPLRR